MKKIFYVSVIAVLLAGSSCSESDRKQQAVKQPNIIFIFTDDQKWNTIAALGNREIITPNLDRIAEAGFVFRNAYCFGGNTGAVCNPSRDMVMSVKVFFRSFELKAQCAIV